MIFDLVEIGDVININWWVNCHTYKTETDVKALIIYKGPRQYESISVNDSVMAILSTNEGPADIHWLRHKSEVDAGIMSHFTIVDHGVDEIQFRLMYQ